MEQKLFSVIIPTFNCGAKLAATLQSVLSQDRNLFEVIVVDGNSTDETMKVIAEHNGQVRFMSEPDRGVYDAMNKGIKLATGKYLIFVGAGDLLKEGVLAQIAGVLPETGPAFVYGGAYLVRHRVERMEPFNKRKFITFNICHQSIFYERTIFDMLGGFDLKYKIYADWAFNMKCFSARRIRKIYVDIMIADFEGWGLSDVQVDHEFWKDFTGLIRKHLGLHHYALYRIYPARVAFYQFRHQLANRLKITTKTERQRVD